MVQDVVRATSLGYFGALIVMTHIKESFQLVHTPP